MPNGDLYDLIYPQGGIVFALGPHMIFQDGTLDATGFVPTASLDGVTTLTPITPDTTLELNAATLVFDAPTVDPSVTGALWASHGILLQSGSTLVASAYTDTTNAANITSGTLPVARLDLSSPPAIGGTAPSTGKFTTVQSTIATGTAPLTVASTTNVANLNASSLGGATFAAPGSIGSGTPGSGAFTTLSASSTVSGAGFSTYLASPPAIGATAPAAITTTQANIGTSSGPNITTGTGVPSSTKPKGSIFIRTDGAAGSTLYVTQGSGTWNAVAGV